MPAITTTAPGKVILLGEHAVVYDRPALAVPVTQVYAKATVSPDISAPQGRVWINAKDIGLSTNLADLPADHPFAVTASSVLETLGITRFPALKLQIISTIPIAAGLGSGAAVAVAMARALAAFVGRSLTPAQASAIAYRTDQCYHGTPSGIDNTVVAYAHPIFFKRSQPFELLPIASPFTLVIANSGPARPTGEVVADVRAAWQKDPARLDALFDQIAEIANQARIELETGNIPALGSLMTRNHALLQQLTVSSPVLDRLVDAAIHAGAFGAKLSGGGRGGNMLALVAPEQAQPVADALTQAGAVNILITQVSASHV